MSLGLGRRVALVALAATAVTGRAGAQGGIRGILIDSLRGGAPVPGATIQLIGATRSTVTDAAGRFRFDDLSAGSWRLATWGPWLDSLGLPPIERTVVLTGTDVIEVVLATPSLGAFQQGRCGTPLPDGFGILLGEVRSPEGEAVARAGVSARWEELRLGRGLLERTPMATVDSTSADGSFVLCGVPIGDDVVLRATSGTFGRSGQLIVRADAPVRRRDLVVAPDGSTVRLRGRVLAPGGTPVVLAGIVPLGDSLATARTDSTGTFEIAAWPRRSTQLLVRALGFEPRTLDVEALLSEVDLDTLQLRRIPPQLATVLVEGRAITVEELEFDQHRRRGMGVQLGAAELGRLAVITVDAVGAMIPRAQVIGTGVARRIVFRRVTITGGRLNQFCEPRFFVDGVDVRGLDPDEQALYLRNAKRVEAYEASFAPARYNDFDGCGVVLIWTR